MSPILLTQPSSDRARSQRAVLGELNPHGRPLRWSGGFDPSTNGSIALFRAGGNYKARDPKIQKRRSQI
jgi:hypothetical protein